MVLNSPTDQGVYVRETCADDSTELRCANVGFNSGSGALNLPVTQNVPLSIFVDSFGSDPFSTTAGPFTLILVMIP